MTTLLIYQIYTKRDYFLKLITLTLVWLILMENFGWTLLFSGLAINVFILHILKKAFPFEPITNIDWFRFVISHFILLLEVYKSGFALIKIVLTGGQTSSTNLQIQIHDKFMQRIFYMWMTLVPGSIVTTIENSHIELVVLHPEHQSAKENIEPVALKLEQLLKNCAIQEKNYHDNSSIYLFLIAKNAVIWTLFMFAVINSL